MEINKLDEDWVRLLDGACCFCHKDDRLSLAGRKSDGTRVFYCRNCDIYNQEGD